MEPYIARALALPLDELEKLTRSDKDYTMLSALALFTRDPTQIRDQLVAVLLAGRDTTAAILSWIIKELSVRPHMVRRLRAEIAAHVSLGATPSFADLKAMKYLQAILNETLRLYPAIPFNMCVALQDSTLPRGGGPDGDHPIEVAKNTIIAYAPICMQRRNDLYPATYPNGTPFPNPQLFEPERWLDSSLAEPYMENVETKSEEMEGEGRAKGGPWVPNSWTYIPFNGSPRMCIGQQFALTEMGYTLVRIFQRYARVERRMSEEDSNGINISCRVQSDIRCPS